MQKFDLLDGGFLLYQECFLPKGMADSYFHDLQRLCAWEQKPGIFGYMQPRLIASYGDPGVTYKYSKITNTALPWLDVLLEIKEKIETVMGRYNYCLLNRYRDGSDSMGWHADDEPEMGPIIGSVSLGETRSFRIRHNKTRATSSFPAGHGTLIIMAGSMQNHYQHEIPKTKKVIGERINLTYREITNCLQPTSQTSQRVK